MFQSKGVFKNQEQEERDIFPLDIIIEKKITDAEVISTCSEIFFLNSKDILIINNIDELEKEVSSNVQIICRKKVITGDFNTFLSFYPQNDSIEQAIANIGDEIAIAKKIANILCCQCMVNDNSSDEDYEEDAYFLVKHTSEDPELVYIDGDETVDDIYVMQNI